MDCRIDGFVNNVIQSSIEMYINANNVNKTDHLFIPKIYSGIINITLTFFKYNLIFYRAREAEDFLNNWDPVSKVKKQIYSQYYQTCSMCPQQMAIFPSNYKRSLVFSELPKSFYRWGYYYNRLTHINIQYRYPYSTNTNICGNHESSQSNTIMFKNPL